VKFGHFLSNPGTSMEPFITQDAINTGEKDAPWNQKGKI
jgi:hypothetical protein